MTLSMYHAEDGDRTLILQREAGRVRAIHWQREQDSFALGDWRDDGPEAELLAAEGAAHYAPAPERPHSAPGDERVIGLGETRLYGTIVHCACHREWDLLKDFAR